MSIEERLENMERELGRVKEVLARSQVAGTAREIRANGFVLEDENGKLRAALSMLKNGPSLMLLDENGSLRGGLGVTKDGSGLALYDENSNTRVALSVEKDGPSLTLVDENGKVIWSTVR